MSSVCQPHGHEEERAATRVLPTCKQGKETCEGHSSHHPVHVRHAHALGGVHRPFSGGDTEPAATDGTAHRAIIHPPVQGGLALYVPGEDDVPQGTDGSVVDCRTTNYALGVCVMVRPRLHRERDGVRRDALGNQCGRRSQDTAVRNAPVHLLPAEMCRRSSARPRPVRGWQGTGSGAGNTEPAWVRWCGNGTNDGAGQVARTVTG